MVLSGDIGRVSVAVMAHPARESFVDELITMLDVDPVVVWDEKSDRWDTGRRSMLAHDPGATHHLVIQDDTLPAKNLVAGIREGLRFIPPDSPMVLYTGKARPYGPLIKSMVQRAGGGASWLVMEQILWGPGVVVPTGIIEDMIGFCDLYKRDGQQYDRRLSRWFEHHDIECYYTWPSLVDHREGPSLVKGRSGGRQAHQVAEDALDVVWTGSRIRVDNVARSARQRRSKAKAQLVEARLAEQRRRLDAGEPV